MTREEMGNVLVANRQWMMSCAMTACGDPVYAEDLVQETSLSALEHYQQFLYGDVRKWLYAILKNCWYMTLVHEGRYPSSLTTDFAGTTEKADDYRDDDDYVCDQNCKESSYSIDDRAYDIKSAFEALDERFRKALLSFSEGYSQKEIAEEMGSTVTTVNNWIHRGRACIKRYYDYSSIR